MEGIFITGITEDREVHIVPQKQQQIDMATYYAYMRGESNVPLPMIEEGSHGLLLTPSVRFFHTRTTCIGEGKTIREPHNLTAMQSTLENIFNNLLQRTTIPEHVEQHYIKFHVPKASGGLREINAPDDDLKEIQRSILYLFRDKLHMLCHDTAYAYIPGRSTKECLMAHQANESQWFLKLDIKDFFPSCTKQFVFKTLRYLYPVPLLNLAEVEYVLDACMLKGALPQGAPSSPYLSNLVMLPYDYEISNRLWDYDKTHYVYTRYADDIIISSRFDFDKEKVEAVVVDALSETPFKIKSEKTRYGSRSGRNWNLGLMLNKDNQLSLGHKFKQRFRAAVFTFLTDATNHVAWSPDDVYQLQGWYSYFRNIEPAYADEIIRRYEEKTGISWDVAMKQML